MNAYKALKKKHDHIQEQMWELYKEGISREGKLESAVYSAFHVFQEINKVGKLSTAKEYAEKAEKYLEKILKEVPIDHYEGSVIMPYVKPD